MKQDMKRENILFLLALMLSLPAAAKIQCNPVIPKINIVFKEKPVTYNNTLSRAEFLKRARGDQSNAIGLTVAEMSIGQSFAYQTESSIQGACSFVTEINFEIGYNTLDVYIDKKYKPGSCAYQVVKEHEDYHVEVARQALQFFEPDIRERLNQMKDKLPVTYGYTAEMSEMEIKNKLNSLFQKEIMPLVRHINQKIDEKNAEIDTPQSYAETHALCRDW